MPEVNRELKSKLRRAERGRKLFALFLVSPLLVFTVIAFVGPIGSILFFSFENEDVRDFMPRTSAAIGEWSEAGLPDEAVFRALHQDLEEGYANKTIARAATSLNHQISGYRSLVMRTARVADAMDPGAIREAIIQVDERWGNTDYWLALRRAARPITARYILASLDLEQEIDGTIRVADERQRIYLNYLSRTVEISLVVTALCLLIGYPMAHAIHHAGPRLKRILLLLVVLPFWTSLLVRTASWLILLQTNGVINSGLQWIGFIDDPIQLIFNRLGVYVATVHVLLPFMVLPLYAVMRSIPDIYTKASTSLGASPTTTFFRIYLPQLVPGIGAGCLLVWVLAVGFYITPALVGGARDQMITYLIAEFALNTANWNMAAALALVLLVMVAAVYPVITWLTGANRVGNVS